MSDKSEDNNTVPYEASTHASLIGVTPAMSQNHNRINDEFLAMSDVEVKSKIIPRDMPPSPGYNLPVSVTPYKQLNSLLGEIGGFRRGEMVVIVSPKNQYNKELVEDLYLGHALVNKPVMIDKTKTPVLLSIVFCDNIDEYQVKRASRYRTLSGDKEDEGFAQARKFGYKHVTISFPNPSSVTLDVLINITRKLEEDNNEVHLVTIDDLSLISRLDAAGQELPLDEIFMRLRSMFNMRGCTVITSLVADEGNTQVLVDSDVADIPKAISRFGFYGGNCRIVQTVDIELVLVLDDDILKMYCGKHRGVMRLEDTKTMTKDNTSGAFLFDVPFVE